MSYYRFWIFYIRIVHKQLNWKHDKTKLTIGNHISRFNTTLYFKRFEIGINLYHLTRFLDIFDKD